jgi:hypothetical protein
MVLGVGLALRGIGGVSRPARVAVVGMIRLRRLGSGGQWRLGRRWELRRCAGRDRKWERMEIIYNMKNRGRGREVERKVGR